MFAPSFPGFRHRPYRHILRHPAFDLQHQYQMLPVKAPSYNTAGPWRKVVGPVMQSTINIICNRIFINGRCNSLSYNRITKNSII